MRVLMLGWEFPPHISGGLGTACAGFTRGLARSGVEVVFVVPRLAGDESAPGVDLVSAEEGVAKRRLMRVPSALSAYETAEQYAAKAPRLSGHYGRGLMEEVRRYADSVAEIAAEESYEIVHGHDWMTYPAAIRAVEARHAPLVLHVHSLEHDRAGPRGNAEVVAIEQRGFDAADAIVCVSGYTADQVRRRYRVNAGKLRVVHNAHDPAQAEAAEERPARAIAEPVVLFLGRVTYQKGPESFLEAAARVVGVEPAIKFVVAGGGDLFPRLVERAAALGLARHVHFTGFLRGADVDRAYAAADVFVMPSVSEPFGIAPLEAAAHGVPVIVSRQSGIVEVLRGALTVDSWDVEDLANKILALVRRPALRSELVRRAREDAQRLTWESQAEALRAVYEELL